MFTRSWTALVLRFPPPVLSGVSTSPSGTVLLPTSYRPLLVLSTLEPPSSSLLPVSTSFLIRCSVRTNHTRADGFDRYQIATGAIPDFNTGLLRITSIQFNRLQSLFFTAGGTTFELTANAQIWPRALNTLIGGTSNGIYLIVNDMGSISGAGLDFVNGYTFLERFYSVFDTANNRVGFATTPFTTATTN